MEKATNFLKNNLLAVMLFLAALVGGWAWYNNDKKKKAAAKSAADQAKSAEANNVIPTSIDYSKFKTVEEMIDGTLEFTDVKKEFKFLESYPKPSSFVASEAILADAGTSSIYDPKTESAEGEGDGWPSVKYFERTKAGEDKRTAKEIQYLNIAYVFTKVKGGWAKREIFIPKGKPEGRDKAAGEA